MRDRVALVAAAFLSVFAMTLSKPAHAGLYSDDLSRCLVSHTSDEDRISFARWIFTVIAVHPSAAPMASIAESDRTDISRETARLFEVLLTESCKAEATQAVKYDGTVALQGSFKVLGEIAMTTLLSDPKVAAESANFAKYIDEAKLKAVLSPAK